DYFLFDFSGVQFHYTMSLKIKFEKLLWIFSDSIVIFLPHDCVCSRVAFVILGKMGVMIC
ncbi:hypothetical protein, partial [Phascolarctobacterium succinatutens]|uniref:hypothetical protein n=1 Tax=Phascolarctobacterium succinatutens TaxID=626940 RepID=UPI0026EC0AFB